MTDLGNDEATEAVEAAADAIRALLKPVAVDVEAAAIACATTDIEAAKGLTTTWYRSSEAMRDRLRAYATRILRAAKVLP